MADKKFNFSFGSGEIVSSSVHKSGDYNYASVAIKRGDNEYVSFGYEWKGSKVPDLAMDILGFMQTSKDDKEKASVNTEEVKKEVAAFIERFKKSCL